MSARWMISVFTAGMSRPRFDDVGREQDVVLAVAELGHHLLEPGRRQLAMRLDDPRLRHDLPHPVGDLGHVLDAGDHAEDLAAAEALALDRLAEHHPVPGHDEGAHRQPIDRRRGDDAHLPHAGQRQLQGARDRRRGQRQHMDVGLQRLQLLLVGDAEMLLLVDDHQPQLGELDRLRQQRMGADDDVDGAVLHPLPHLRRILGRHHAGELRDLDRQPLEAGGEGAVVLARQQGGRHHHGHLHARHGDDEGGAQRHLGLAEADVAADQPVHRPAGGQVLEDIGDGALLVLGLGEGEAGAELVPGPLRRRRQHPLASPAARRRCG